MSIMKNRKAQYRNIGGVPTPGRPAIGQVVNTGQLPGVQGQQTLDTALASGTPLVEIGDNYEQTLGNILDWSANPQNVPQFYTGDTVADFDPLQLEAQNRLAAQADQTDALTGQLLDSYQQQLDPTSAYNQQIAQEAAQSSANAFFGAGTPGSSRGAVAANLASQRAIRDSQEQARSGIAAQRDKLTQGSQILDQLGATRQEQLQNIINEDIKRFNWAQLTPQQQIDRIISIQSTLEGLRRGAIPASSGQGSSSIFNSIASAAGNAIGTSAGNFLGGLFSNEGGEVPVMPEQDPMMMDQGMTPAGPMAAPPAPMADSGMPGGIMSGMGSEPLNIKEPEGILGMEMSMTSEEPMSAIDTIEAQAEALAATLGGDVTITRKTKKSKSKRGK